MAIQKWEPFKDIDRFFEQAASPFFSSIQRVGRDFAVDVYEDDGSLVTEMNVPGIDPEDIDITLEDGYMTVSGTREEKREEDKKNYFTREIRRGGFRRTVRLPQGVNEEDIEATHKDGVLKVTVPYERTQSDTKKKIEIKKEE